MTSVPSTTTAAPAAATPAAAATAKGLGADSDTFLKLMVANLQHQDPMQPQDSSQYVQQLSQMTMVEQITALAKTSADTLRQSRRDDAVALLGKTVTYVDDAGSHTGVVSEIDLSSDVPTLTVDGARVPSSTVTGVR